MSNDIQKIAKDIEKLINDIEDVVDPAVEHHHHTWIEYIGEAFDYFFGDLFD